MLAWGSVWPSPTTLAQVSWVPLKYYIKQVRKVGRGSLFEHTLRQLRLAQRFRRGEVFKSQIRAYLTSLLNKVTTVTWARLFFDLFCKSVHTLRWFCVVADHRGGRGSEFQENRVLSIPYVTFGCSRSVHTLQHFRGFAHLTARLKSAVSGIPYGTFGKNAKIH